MDNSGEILRLCRLCLVKDHVNISIFDDPDNVRHIPLKINSCLPVKVARDDNLPQKICIGCSSKLDLCYEFWISTANAEKTLLSMVLEKQNQICEPQVPKPILVKEEPQILLETSSELGRSDDTEIGLTEALREKEGGGTPVLIKEEVDQLLETPPESMESEEMTPAKRPRRSAAVKAQMNISPESDDEDHSLELPEKVSEMEDNIEDPDVPDMSVDINDIQPGPSGLNQEASDSKSNESDLEGFDVVDATTAEPNQKKTVRRLRGTKPQLVVYCPKCGEHCENYNDYDKHLLANPSHQSFECFQCKKHADSVQDLKRHAEKAHPIEKFLTSTQGGGYFCHFCGSKEMSIKKLETHIQNDHVKWALECTMCPRFYKNPQSLYNHFEVVHAVINNVDFLCNQCGLHFYDPEIYALHMNKYHNVELKSLTYQCVLCTSKLKEVSDFLRHVHKHGKYTVNSEEMKDERPAFAVWSRQCFICSKVVQDRNELKDHLLNVHFSTTICPLCNIKVKGKMELHLREEHSLSMDINLKRDNERRHHFPFVISEPKNKPAPPNKSEKICEVCYGVVAKKAFFQHMTMHKNRGTHQLKSRNPVVDTVPNQNQLSFCKTCRLKVVTTFMMWHKNIHKKHEKKRAKRSRSRSPVRPRKRSRPRTSRERSRSWDRARVRAEMKCTECDRSYDTVENLVNHVKAQHFSAPIQPSSYNPYMGTGMVPMEFHTLGAAEPFGFQNPIPDVNTVSLGNFSQLRNSDRTGSSRTRKEFRNRSKF